MAELLIDMSGRGGLGKNFAGYTDQLTTTPNLSNQIKEGEMAKGYFNPYIREGYLHPIVSTTTTLTTDSAPASRFIASEYNHTDNEPIFLDDVKSIYNASSLTDTSLTKIQDLSTTNDYGTFSYTNLYDAQIYQVNGVDKLFVVGEGVPYNGLKLQVAATSAIPEAWATGEFSVNPSGGTAPTILYSARKFTASPGTSETLSVTVPSGSNRCLFVFVIYSTTNTNSYVYSSGDSVSLTMAEEVKFGPSVYTAYKVNPAVGTYDLSVASSGSYSNLLIYAVVTNNTHQTYPMDSDRDYELSSSVHTDANIYFDAPYVNANQLNIVAGLVKSTTEISNDVTEVTSSTNAYGSDFLVTTPASSSGLMVGVLDLPLVGTDTSRNTWLASWAQGGFIETLESDYAFMRTADNGFAYLFAKNKVHKIDGTITGGTNGTVTKDVLLFPSWFTITDALDYRSQLYMAVHQYPVNVATSSLNTYTGKCGIVVWNRISTQLGNTDFIELPGVKEIKKIYASPDGVLKLITISDNGRTELRKFGYNDSGGVVFPVIKDMGIGAFPQFPDGLSSAGDKVIWLANDGQLYCEKGDAITQLFSTTAPGSTSSAMMDRIDSGAILYGSGDETSSTGFRSNKQAIWMSYKLLTSEYYKKIYPFDLTNGSNTAQTPEQGDVYTGINYIPVTSVIRQVRIYNAPITGTGSTVIATVKLYFNQSATASMTKTITKDEAKRGYVDFHINKPYLHALQIEVEWSTSITMGEDTYLPSVAVVSHDPTTTKSPDNG